MKMTIQFNMGNVADVTQDVEIFDGTTKEDLIEGLNDGMILTSINTNGVICNIANGYVKIGKVISTEFDHDTPYSEFKPF